MSVLQPDVSLNTTGASSYSDKFEDLATAKIKNCVKDLLKSRLFLGRYLERRLADQRIGYRDVVLLSAAEVELKRDLIEAQHNLRSVYHKQWIGITSGEPIGYLNSICLWTEIDNQPFGVFWFQIKSLKFRDDEVIIQLKCVRHITDAYLELEPLLTGSCKKSAITNVVETISKPATNSENLSDTYNELVSTLKSAITIRNMKEFITFIVALVIAVFTGSSALITFLGNFILALVREFSILVKNSTPMFLGLLDFMSKLVGGFYILVAMIFRPSPGPPSRDIRKPYKSSRQPSITYDSRDFD